MNVQHQVSDELLLDYASGNLSEGWSLAVATHLALCPQARRRLQAMEGAAGALFDKISVSEKATDTDWDRLFPGHPSRKASSRSHCAPIWVAMCPA